MITRSKAAQKEGSSHPRKKVRKTYEEGSPISKSETNKKSNSHSPRMKTRKSQESEPNETKLEFEFDFDYPLKVNLDDSFQPSKTGLILSNYQISIINEIINKWSNGINTVLIDETNFSKLSIISNTINAIKSKVNSNPPFLIITSIHQLSKWLYDLGDWCDSINYYVFGNGKSERKVIGNRSLFYSSTNTDSFDVMLITRDQFLRNCSSLPKLKWSSVIIDDFTSFTIPISSTLQAITKIQSYHTLIILKSVDGLESNELLSIHHSIDSSNDDIQNITQEEFFDSLQPNIIHVSIDECAESNIFNEVLLLCPMTNKQQKNYQQLLNEIHRQLSIIDDNSIVNYSEQLLNASTDIILNNENDDVINSTNSGKLIVLQKLLDQQRYQNRNIIIICANNKTSELIHIYLQEHQITHIKIDDTIRQQQRKRILTQFNVSNESTLLILTAEYFVKAFNSIDPDTLVLFDIKWTPLMNPNEVVKWLNRSSIYPPQIIHLMTKYSFEHVLYNYYWHHRDEQYLNFNDINLLLKSIKINISLIKEFESVRGTNWATQILNEAPLINFCDENLFPEFPEEDIEIPIIIHEEEEQIPNNNNKSKTKSNKTIIPINMFWTKAKILEFIDLLRNFGYGRWKMFNMNRNQNEYIKLSSCIFKLTVNEPEKYEIINNIIHQISLKEFKRFSSSLKSINSIITEVNINELIEDINILSTLKTIYDEENDYITLEGYHFQKLTDEWTEENDIILLKKVYNEGLYHLDNEIYEQHVRNILNTITNYKKEIMKLPTIISLPIPKRFNLTNHNKIIYGLMSYGLPNINDFYSIVDITNYSPEDIYKYANHIIKYCSSTPEERKPILSLLTEKIPKYTVSKINQRIKLFEQIRQSKNLYFDYPAEDLEYLDAISFHGFNKNSISPILIVSCYGSCSEIKLHTRVKTIFSTHHKSRITQRIPNDVYNMSPLKVNDMMVILKLGVIDGRKEFSNKDFIYPIGYEACCVCMSPLNVDAQIWIKCAINEKDNAPFFEIIPYNENENESDVEFRFVGLTPEEPFEQLRKVLMKKSRKFIPPIYGHEMFGLTSAVFHRLVINMPGIEKCTEYIRRFFCTNFQPVSKWPVIGQFEKESEKQQNLKSGNNNAKFKFKKKLFGDMLPPLVIDLNPLYNNDRGSVVLGFHSNSLNLKDLVNNYKSWDKEPT